MGGSYRDRGQLILVTAVSLAAVFVTVALVLNSAIYTENVATRTNQQEPREAAALQQAAVTGAGAGLDHAHHDPGSHASYTALENEMESQLLEWTELNMRDAARDGRLVDAEYTGTSTRGTRVAQNDGTTYEPQDTAAVYANDFGLDGDLDTWVVATDVNRIRTHEMTIDTAQLQTEAQGDVEANLSDIQAGVGADVAASDLPFATVYNEDDGDGTLDHAFAIYIADADSSDVKITHWDYDAGVTQTCTVEDAPSTMELSISEQRVTGADGECEAVFEFVSGLASPYEMLYVEGDEVTGDYEFIIDSSNSDFEDDMTDLSTILFGEFYESHSDGHSDSYSPTSPFIEPALYSVDVRVVYRSGSVKYASEATIAPEEPE